MKRRKRELVEKGASRDQIRMIETQIAARLKRYNEQLSGVICSRLRYRTNNKDRMTPPSHKALPPSSPHRLRER